MTPVVGKTPAFITKRLGPGMGLYLGLALSTAFIGSDALAQSSSLQSGGLQSAADRTGALVEELNTLLDKGERERLIDPWFLRDLRTVIGKYDRPWSAVLLRDDFSSRGPEPDPPWQVTAGEFLIDWRFGLRSVIENNAATQSTQGTSPTTDEKDIGKALLGALLQNALQGGQSGSQSGGSQQQASSQSTFAAVQAPLSISNAFAIDVTVSSRPLASGAEEGFEFGPYQGIDAGSGYRLSYLASERSLQLLKVTARGVATIDGARLASGLTDEQSHQISWTRDRDGVMTIQIDGQDIITVTDRSFRDPFDGFAILNRGGDLAVREVTVAGVPN